MKPFLRTALQQLSLLSRQAEQTNGTFANVRFKGDGTWKLYSGDIQSTPQRYF